MEPRNMRPDDMEGRREADRINDLITRAGGIVRYLEGPRYTAKEGKKHDIQGLHHHLPTAPDAGEP